PGGLRLGHAARGELEEAELEARGGERRIGLHGPRERLEPAIDDADLRILGAEEGMGYGGGRIRDRCLLEVADRGLAVVARAGGKREAGELVHFGGGGVHGNLRWGSLHGTAH